MPPPTAHLPATALGGSKIAKQRETKTESIVRSQGGTLNSICVGRNAAGWGWMGGSALLLGLRPRSRRASLGAWMGGLVVLACEHYGWTRTRVRRTNSLF